MRLEQLMADKGIKSLPDLAAKADLDYHTVWRIATGDREFRQEHLEKLAKALEVEIPDLFKSARNEQQRALEKLILAMRPEDQELLLTLARSILARRGQEE